MSIPDYTWDRPINGNKMDPVNLLFTNTDLANVLAHFDSQGWHHKITDLAHDQYIPDTPPRKAQDAHRMNGPLWRRYHVRIWVYKGQFVTNAHYETLRHNGHEVHHHEGAEEKVADDFSSTGTWTVSRDKHRLGNRELEKYNNGYATEISG